MWTFTYGSGSICVSLNHQIFMCCCGNDLAVAVLLHRQILQNDFVAFSVVLHHDPSVHKICSAHPAVWIFTTLLWIKCGLRGEHGIHLSPADIGSSIVWIIRAHNRAFHSSDFSEIMLAKLHKHFSFFHFTYSLAACIAHHLSLYASGVCTKQHFIQIHALYLAKR